MKLEKKAYAKINLGLDVTGKRDDGYHIVRMIMQNVDLYDTLTFEDNETGEICLTASSAASLCVQRSPVRCTVMQPAPSGVS